MDEDTKRLVSAMAIALIASVLVFIFSPLSIISKIFFTAYAFVVEYFYWYYCRVAEFREGKRTK